MFGIRAGRAFDGDRSMPGGALVLVDEGGIAGVAAGTAPAPAGCEVLEIPDGTILPGLVDAHVHLCADGTDGTLDRIREPGLDAMVAVIEQSLRQHLAAGVTTVRDLGDRQFAVLDWRSRAGRRGVFPAVVTAGPPITSVAGHCANMGGEAAGVQQLRAAAGTAVCPTVGFAGTPRPPPNAAAVLAKAGMTFEQMIETRKRRLAEMHAAGVRVVSGSDGGISAAKPHGLLPISTAFLTTSGVSTVAALASATALAAGACKLGDRKGRLRAGYDADLLVVAGDPVADIGDLSRPLAVFAAGRRAV